MVTLVSRPTWRSYSSIWPAWQRSQINAAPGRDSRIKMSRGGKGLGGLAVQEPSKAMKRLSFSTTPMGPDRCIFCQIVSKRSPSSVVYEDDRHIGFLDIYPFSRGHTLVCPKEHGETIWDMNEADIAQLFQVRSEERRVGKSVD